jgi:predicted AlkP superfamily pyrophosphatase or phosphodiesterase
MKRPSSSNSIMNVSRSILRFYDLYHAKDTVKVLDQALDHRVRHVVYMLLDGFGLNIIKAHLPKDAFLRQFLKKTITSVFPSTTTAATTAVLSAKPPIETGYLGWV